MREIKRRFDWTTRIMVNQRNRVITFPTVHFIGSLDASWSEWYCIVDPDPGHFKETNLQDEFFGMTWIRINVPRLLGSWLISGTNEVHCGKDYQFLWCIMNWGISDHPFWFVSSQRKSSLDINIHNVTKTVGFSLSENREDLLIKSKTMTAL